MSTIALLYILSIAAIMQKKIERLRVAGAYVIILGISDMLFGSLGGDYYYIADSFTYWFILLVMTRFKVTDLTIGLSIVCQVSIMVNLYGWIAWDNFVNPLIYSIMFVFLYVYTVILMLIPEKINNGDIKNNNNNTDFHFTFAEQLQYLSKSKEKV